jgi:5-methyltetrahydropteroyltriglutamate--homocysteine methyltransferase
VEDQLVAGIEVVSDGQTRYDMIAYFARVIDGYQIEGNECRIVGKIGRVDTSTFAGDFRYVKSLVGDRAKIKGIVTGPITMGFSSIVETEAYEGPMDRRLYMDLAEALLRIARLYEDLGADVLQIDEPYLSVGAPMDVAQEAIELISTGVSKIPVALHACGDVTRIFDRLLSLKGVSILSHAFKGCPNNLKFLDRDKLMKHGKKIGFGCIDTATERVETIGEVEEIVRLATAKVGLDNVIVHPDCGLRPLSYETAFAKLRVMAEAARRLR